MTHQRNDIRLQGAVRERDTVADRTVERQEKEKAPWHRPVIRSLGALADTEQKTLENEKEFGSIHKRRS